MGCDFAWVVTLSNERVATVGTDRVVGCGMVLPVGGAALERDLRACGRAHNTSVDPVALQLRGALWANV